MNAEKKRAHWVNWVLFLTTIVVVFLLGLFASSITERRAENEYVYKPRVVLDEYEPRNDLWGENYPREYQSYLKTADTAFRSEFNGNGITDALDSDPRMVILWAGYSFSSDYMAPRGHFYAITDIRNTLRTGSPRGPGAGPQPATCWTCKSPDVPRLMEKMGPTDFYKGKWAAWGEEVVNYIGCADCHDPKTMDLRITRPALVEAFQAMGKDISRATHQEMRSLVCAQCHVEYFFDKKKPEAPEVAYLTFPWKFGTTADSVLKYYNTIDFTDFSHQISKAPILKAQHPDYEVFLTGIHAQRGVACADCHMPYIKEGGQKFTSHRITSPLQTISNTCQVCHREPEEILRNDVYERQRKVKEMRNLSENELVRAHVEAAAAWASGATKNEMEPIQDHIRNSQWYWDYSAAGHGNAFHSPGEVLRILGLSIAESKEARIMLARVLASHGKNNAISYPDISSKTLAQKYIGLNMEKLRMEKNEWIRTIPPEWDKKARIREEGWPVQKEHE